MDVITVVALAGIGGVAVGIGGAVGGFIYGMLADRSSQRRLASVEAQIDSLQGSVKGQKSILARESRDEAMQTTLVEIAGALKGEGSTEEKVKKVVEAAAKNPTGTMALFKALQKGL